MPEMGWKEGRRRAETAESQSTYKTISQSIDQVQLWTLHVLGDLFAKSVLSFLIIQLTVTGEAASEYLQDIFQLMGAPCSRGPSLCIFPR